MSVNQGDIVWIDWRFIDKIDEGQSKPRPCLVISNKNCHDVDKGDILLCPMTSNTRLNNFTYLIDNRSLSRSLAKFTEVRTNKIFTYKSAAIIKRHGEIIDEEVLKEIISKVFNGIKYIG